MPIDPLREEQVIDRILGSLRRRQGGWVGTVNLDILRQVSTDASVRRLFETADLVVADGMPLIWGSRIGGRALPERVAGATLIWTLSRAAAQAGFSVFLLGGNPGVARDADARLREVIPGLNVSGTHCPPRGFEHSEADTTAMLESLRASQPDIVFCGLGCPKQEHLIQRLLPAFPNTWFIASGASMSFVAGETPRAPEGMQRLGLEWLHRLVHEPRRLFGRYVVHDLPFALTLFSQSLLDRIALSRP